MCAERRAEGMRLSRRAWLGALLGLAAASGEGRAHARGRTPFGGRVALRVPWPLGSIDAHRNDDVTAGILGDALFDGLYAFGDGGKPVAVLAEGDPEVSGTELRVRVRGGLTTAAGRALGAREVIASISRARGTDARGWLADVPNPRRDGESLLFAMTDAAKLTRALASPLLAVVAGGFVADRPDGTGAFRFERRTDGVGLVRNARAARGGSFLDEVLVREGADLAASLRAFEAGTDDLGWLGAGLHEPRAGSRPFDVGAIGWALLRTGKDAGTWDAPGVAQRLCDGIAPARLAHLALGAPWSQLAEQAWGGAPCDLLVRDDSPWLIELARSVAATLSRPGHEVTAKLVALRELRERRATRTYVLAIDAARAFAPGTLGALAGLATADGLASSADAIRHPPRVGEVPARTLTRSMRLGVLGDIRVQGARISDVTLAPSPLGVGVDWGNVTRVRRGP